ncbi:MAG: helix-turn-helix transcriptional regulator [Rhodospirillaceae bacterium]|nr:helix-turn-helix transcriptional regulator [Rhodospirillaceae bacterium]
MFPAANAAARPVYAAHASRSARRENRARCQPARSIVSKGGIPMGKVDPELGGELRRRRLAGGDTLESLGSKMSVSEKMIGKWERSEAMPSATNIRMLEKFGLIEDWLGRNRGNGRYPKGASQGTNDWIAPNALEHPGSQRHGWEKMVEGACERELVAAFRAFAVDERDTILEVLQLLLAKLHPGD